VISYGGGRGGTAERTMRACGAGVGCALKENQFWWRDIFAGWTFGLRGLRGAEGRGRCERKRADSFRRIDGSGLHRQFLKWKRGPMRTGSSNLCGI